MTINLTHCSRYVLLLALLWLSACSTAPVEDLDEQGPTESYYFRGGSVQSASGFTSAQRLKLSERLESMVLAGELYLRQTSGEDRTDLRDMSLAALEAIGTAGDGFGPVISSGGGSLLAGAEQSQISLRLELPGEGLSIVLSGTFETEVAQAAIETLKYSPQTSSAQTGSQTFSVGWIVEGTVDGQPVSGQLLQQFRMLRLRGGW